jgi:hypothetical protein
LNYGGSISTIFIRNEADEDISIKEVVIKQAHADTFFYALSPETVPAEVTSSSELSTGGAYDPRQLFDGRLDFGWAEGARNNGEGESLAFAFEKAVSIDGIYIANGYQRSEDHFRKNGRVKTFDVYADGKLVQTIPLKDDMGYQYIEFDAPFKAKTVVLKIASTYPGSRYTDTVISELKFSDKTRVIDIATDFEEKASKRILFAAENNILKDFIDKNLSMDVQIGETGTYLMVDFKFRTNGSFVIWMTREEGDGEVSTSKVIDGNWTIDSANRDKAVLSLFGKKNEMTTEMNWSSPYSDEETTESTEIFSDKMTIVKFTPNSSGLLSDVLSEILGDNDPGGIKFVVLSQTFVGLFPFSN